jgi:hypothetical protein
LIDWFNRVVTIEVAAAMLRRAINNNLKLGMVECGDNTD